MWLGFVSNLGQYCQVDNDGDYTLRETYTEHPSGTPTESPTNDPTDNVDSVNASFTVYFAIILTLALTLCLPTTCAVTAFVVIHSKRSGSDRPNYPSIFKFFTNIADFYSDIIWALILVSQQSVYAVYALVFTLGPHVLSIAVGIMFVIKWKTTRTKLYISGYADHYGRLVLLCTVFAGFYSTVELITSHLFHLNALSLQIGNGTRSHIRTLRTLNVVILENIPLLVIQCLFLAEANLSLDSLPVFITLITVIFRYDIC